MFDNIILEQEQIDLLIELVEIVRSYPRNQRRKLIYVQDHDGAQLIIPGHSDKNLDVLIGDLETLSREGLLAQTDGSSGTSNFDITPLGFRYVDDKIQNTPNDKNKHSVPKSIDLHAIKTSGKKDIPKDTEIQIKKGKFRGTVQVSVKLPGQKRFSDLGNLKIIDGVIELPVKLVFFSYAREDQVSVQKISDKLWEDGYLTWLDKKDLLPGDDWEIRIEEGIERADYVLVFLSPSSISKTGYVQKEFKYALEQQELRPSGKRFIIPILLEPCDPPREFRKLHWLKYWEIDSYETLRRSLSN